MYSNTITKGFLALLSAMIFLGACSTRSGDPRVLVFAKTEGYYHESIPDGLQAIMKLGQENGFSVDTTTQAEMFTEEILQQYSAVVFLSTTGDVLNHYQEADFERYIQAGGGFVGIHAAADTEYDWPWYGKMTGGYFSDHPGINDPHPNVQEGSLDVVDKSHGSTSFLPDQWARTDEWYSYKNLNEDVNVLITLDESSYQGGEDMGEHPIAWYHEYDGGRAFYTGGGHTSQSFQEELFLRHLVEGIRYAIGANKKLDYSRASSKRVPEADRFAKVNMVSGEFTEPTEMAILPNLDILVSQRRGEILLYKNGDSTTNQVAHLDVYWKTDAPRVNAEEGLMGIKADPDYENNHWVYVFYSPTGKSVNRLSRFKFESDEWNMDTEQVILEFYSQRDICCHTGGSIAFDSEGLLYVSAGDNSTPFNQPNQPHTLRGYAPLDERPGFEQYDAARSSGNTNDLRGKIIRIKVNEDGSYSIPEGNLYPEGMAGTKPEIYVQGNRNPYRISVDQKTGYLYWGEVGPDARADSLGVRGPKGYDEVNQAKEAGFFGWPFFVGDNYPYNAYDFDTGESGIQFDPLKPVNLSRNNTGLKELPPAQPAFIYYPYVESPEFPQVGTGGRNAMAGPVYYSDLYPNGGGLPDYYDGKLFIYDWIRGWIKAVTMDENGDYVKMEPFMADVRQNALIDLELGPDGKLYLLEYGNGWFSANEDAALSVIAFNPGNRAPVVTGITSDKTSGTLPLQVQLQVKASDPEKDALTYTWDLGNGEYIDTTEPQLTYTYESVGDYDISVTVRDTGKEAAKSPVLNVYAGNVAPEVHIQFAGNSSFYFPGKSVAYEVTVTDPDDLEAGNDLSTLYVSADYIEGFDQAEAAMGHQIMSEAMAGKSIMESLTCKTCHQVDEASVGPAYTEVAKKYADDPDAADHLINKIIKGGSGVWGETMMPANPSVKEGDARKIVAWVLSLGELESLESSLPPAGSLDPLQGKPLSNNGVMILNASFTDRGGETIKPLTSSATAYLRNSKISFDELSETSGFNNVDFEGQKILIAPTDRGHVALKGIDLTGLKGIDFTAGSQNPFAFGYQIEARVGSPDGPLIGQSILRKKPEQGRSQYDFQLSFENVPEEEMQDLYLVTVPLNEAEKVNLAFLSMEMISE
ncbi:Glucose/arabinose dehydrogenase, beta-propeller fold [Cyclobacterium xiamenense]|uniref:Glucose/arabinose dehydrogenase, beta-propeller fold n=1 Tax=Cyclobacterium xiamenense TaxID=1297121 RepID=A0A1H6W0K5_9BACT|nr:ThuA domain-containing protein [Cyclobacterium xiamenense]SEJ10468.1 Glucose/arabinose dehydrogenase, beta-propeller fold [Cyclobacterium xiamenense]